MRKLKILVAALTALVLPAAAQQSKAPAENKTTTAAPAFNRALLNPATLQKQAPDVYEVKFTTTRGDFTVKVTRAWAPRGADRFYNLVKNGFYDGAAFFRVLPGFMAQFGISAHPQVSHIWQTATIADDAVKQSNKRGFLSFATAGPNSRTTQVFINFGNNARLDSMGFSPFGEVIEGMNVVDLFYDGYGEGGPSGNGPRQDLIQSQGRAYLEKEFRKLDVIKATTVTSPAAKTPTKPDTEAPAKKTS